MAINGSGEKKTPVESIKQWGANGLKTGSFVAGVMLPIAAVVLMMRWFSPSTHSSE